MTWSVHKCVCVCMCVCVCVCVIFSYVGSPRDMNRRTSTVGWSDLVVVRDMESHDDRDDSMTIVAMKLRARNQKVPQ